jgi:hypothetical protein
LVVSQQIWTDESVVKPLKPENFILTQSKVKCMHLLQSFIQHHYTMDEAYTHVRTEFHQAGCF